MCRPTCARMTAAQIITDVPCTPRLSLEKGMGMTQGCNLRCGYVTCSRDDVYPGDKAASKQRLRTQRTFIWLLVFDGHIFNYFRQLSSRAKNRNPPLPPKRRICECFRPRRWSTGLGLDAGAVPAASTRGRNKPESFLCGMLAAQRPETIENSIL